MERREYEKYSPHKKYKKYMRPSTQELLAHPPSPEGSATSSNEDFVIIQPLPPPDPAKRADFVFVYSESKIEDDEYKASVISTFVKNIKQTGLTVEESTGQVLDDLIGIQVKAPDSVLTKYSAQFRIELCKDNPYYHYPESFVFECMTNPATNPKQDDLVVSRAQETLSGDRPNGYTNAEKILIVEKILAQVKFGDEKGEIGYRPLVENDIFLAAYPLHDSLYEWTEEGTLTDRQLLAKYWASPKCIYKEQPLSLIHKYYGPEVGFYFAWLGYYTKMLLIPAAASLICFLLGLIYYFCAVQYIEDEICKSEQFICPACPSLENCTFVPLKNSCEVMKLAQIIENPVTVIYSCFMCFWGVVFMVLWKRKQAGFNFKWNLQGADIISHRSIRPEYIRVANIKFPSSLADEKLYYLPLFQRLGRLAISYFGVLLILFIFCLGLMSVIYYRLNLMYYDTKNSASSNKSHNTISTITSSILTFLIITFFGLFDKTVAKKLTKWENPRTHKEFYRRYKIKLAIFAIGNVLLPTAYLAFFKGHFYTHPGDPTQWRVYGLFKSDVCAVSGCLVDLSVQLAIILVLNNGKRMLKEIYEPTMKVMTGREKTGGFGSQWEEDFILVEHYDDFIYHEYIQLVIQYSFMTFFLVSLPIAPLLTLINNIVEIRFDAWKMTRQYRRVVPKQVRGIEEWNIVLQVITILGAISNPLLIAFNSNFISKYIYSRRHQSLKGFINSTLSDFSVSDYPGYADRRGADAIKTCQYAGMRYPPSHPEKYDYTLEYWYQFAVKAIFFIILENVCLLLSLFLGYMIPEVPRKIQMRLDNDQNTLQQMRLAARKS